MKKYNSKILDEEEMIEIQLGLDNIKKGRVKPIEQVAKELGIIIK